MNRLTKLVIILAIGIILTGCTQNTGKIIGIKIYEYKVDYFALTTRWKEMGINTAFISNRLAGNDTLRQALKKNNFAKHPGISILYRPVFYR